MQATGVAWGIVSYSSRGLILSYYPPSQWLTEALRLEGSWIALELFAYKDTRVTYGDRIQKQRKLHQ
jgi:hypothetical protein